MLTAAMAIAVFALPFGVIALVGWLIYLYVKRQRKQKEQAALAADIDRLYAELQTLTAAAPRPEDVGLAIIKGGLTGFLEDGKLLPHPDICEAFDRLFGELYVAETYHRLPDRPTGTDRFRLMAFREALVTQIAHLTDNRALGTFVAVATKVFSNFAATLPPLALVDLDAFERAAAAPASPTTVPLIDLIDAGQAVGVLALSFYDDDVLALELFARLRARFVENLHAVSRVPFTVEHRNDPRLVFPSAFKGAAGDCVAGYLTETPLMELFAVRVPFALPQAARVEHHWIVAGSGHGKTQLLQHLILDDLQRPDPPALIVVDSQGDMLRKLERLALFEDTDRLILIDPEDDEPPALNLFDMATGRLSGYSRLIREQVEAGIIELYNYIFGSLAADLTAKQGTAFAFVTRLMLALPGATIHTLRELMEEDARTVNDSRFAEAIHALDPTARAFFENQFYNRNAFGPTRQQIARRLYGVLQVPAFDRMLSSPDSRLDMFAAMQQRKVVLVNTSKALLKDEASALFGRFMIAQTLRAAYERAALSEHERSPAFLVIDEAADYFDDGLEALLNQARKFNLGVVFAHQFGDQLTPAMRAAVAANTSIKMAGGVSDRDARALAADMRTTPEFLASQKKDSAHPPRWTQFACFVRNQTDRALTLRVPFYAVEQAPTMSAAALADLKARNRARYAAGPDPSRQAATSPGTPGRPTTVEAHHHETTTLTDYDDWRS